MTFIKFLQKMCKVYGVSITDVMHFLEGDNVSVDIPMSLQRIYDIDVNKSETAKRLCNLIILFIKKYDDNDYEKAKSLLFIKEGFAILYREAVDPCPPNVFSLTICGLINFYDELNDLIRRDYSCRSSGVVNCPFHKKEIGKFTTPEENTMEITIKTNPDQEKEKELASLLQSIEL